MAALDSSSSNVPQSPPKAHVPNATAETSSSVLPRHTYRIAISSLQWQLGRRRIAVLLAAHGAVVTLRALEELEVPIRGEGSAAPTEDVHLFWRHRREAARNGEVLAEHGQRVDAADRRRDGEAHAVAQPFLRGADPVQDRLTIAAEALHAEHRDAASLELREHLLLEASIRPVEAGARHLHGVEGTV